MWSQREKGVHLGLDMRSQRSKAGPTADCPGPGYCPVGLAGSNAKTRGASASTDVTQRPGRGRHLAPSLAVPPLSGEERRGLWLCHVLRGPVSQDCVPLCTSKLWVGNNISLSGL